MRRGATLVRIGGIAVRADASWLVAVALVTWSLWDRFDHDPRFGGSAAFPMALAAAALLFLSVVAHEVAHALEARSRGVPVGGITLFLFGGVTDMRAEARRPIDEFALTAVGPFTSLAVGCLFGLVATTADHLGLSGLAEVFGVVGWLNVGLAVFNLLPGAPLDGGRIVRAIAWKVTGDRHRAARIAAGAGQVLGSLLFALGLFEVFFVPALFTNGLWLTFLGWFLTSAAKSEMTMEELRQTLAARPLRRFTTRGFDPIPADATVDDAIERWFRLYDRDAFFVADEPPGPVVGVLTLDDVRRVPPEARGRVPVGDVMRPIDDVPWLDADTPSSAVLDQLEGDGVAVVFDDGEPLGLVTLDDVLARLRRDDALGRVPAGPVMAGGRR
jgi:Zn-dependent protease/CBS domain-containing protein